VRSPDGATAPPILAGAVSFRSGANPDRDHGLQRASLDDGAVRLPSLQLIAATLPRNALLPVLVETHNGGIRDDAPD
jgi:hypothetical protein